MGLLQYRDRRHEDSGWCAHRAGHEGDPAVGRVLRRLDDRAAERLELTCSRHLAGHEPDPARSPAGSRVTCRHPPSSVARPATVNRYNRYDDGGSLKSSVRRSSREPVSRRMACSDEIAGYSPAVSRSVRVMGWLRASRAPPGGQPAPEGRQRPGHHKDAVFTLPEIFREAGAGIRPAVIATAERLGITRVATVDRRHFTVVLPKHVGSFALLPDPLNGRRSDPQGHPENPAQRSLCTDRGRGLAARRVRQCRR